MPYPSRFFLILETLCFFLEEQFLKFQMSPITFFMAWDWAIEGTFFSQMFLPSQFIQQVGHESNQTRNMKSCTLSAESASTQIHSVQFGLSQSPLHPIQATGASRAVGQDIHSIPQVTQHGDVKLGIIIILMISHLKPSDHLMQMFDRKGERTRLCGTPQVAGLLPSININ